MRALGLLAVFPITGDAPATSDRSSRPSDPVPPLDDETLLAWRAWALEARDAGSPARVDAGPDGGPLGVRPPAGARLIGEG